MLDYEVWEYRLYWTSIVHGQGKKHYERYFNEEDVIRAYTTRIKDPNASFVNIYKVLRAVGNIES